MTTVWQIDQLRDRLRYLQWTVAIEGSHESSHRVEEVVDAIRGFGISGDEARRLVNRYVASLRDAYESVLYSVVDSDGDHDPFTQSAIAFAREDREAIFDAITFTGR